MIIFPSLKRAVNEDGGQRKLARWTRIGTIFVCLLQALAVTQYARGIPNCIPKDPNWSFYAIIILTVTAGSMTTVWLGDQITAHGIGNGVSMLIFAGIVALHLSSAHLCINHIIVHAVETEKFGG